MESEIFVIFASQPQNSTAMKAKPIILKGKSRIHFNNLPFKPQSNQVFFYDPNPNSALSKEIESKVKMIKKHLGNKGFEFYCFSDIAKQMTEETVRYFFPNWNGEPLNHVGNDLLKSYLAEEDLDIGASFIRLFDVVNETYSCYQLYSTKTHTLRRQLNYYRKAISNNRWEDRVEFSITAADIDLDAIYEQTFDTADADSEELSRRLTAEVQKMAKRLHQENVGEFVLRCMVPVERRLSKVIITPKYEVVLPDYGNMPIAMRPLPKAVFLLYLKHEGGINFKELVDYQEELYAIYTKVTNRVDKEKILNSLNKLTDPTKNIMNEVRSRIHEAFVKRMEEQIAENYCIMGDKGETKRISLPRNLVEWQCEL